MSIKELDTSDPSSLSEDELQYAFDRYLITEEAFLEHSSSKTARKRRAQMELADAEAADAPAESDDDYTTWSVARLTKEVKSRNSDREPEDRIKPESARKDDIVAALVEDDEITAGV